MPTPSPAFRLRELNLLFLSQPRRWSLWPFLPLVKRLPGQAEEYGVLFDALGCCDLAGFSASVFLSNYFLLPGTLDELLRLPRETFDAPEEVFEAGWRVD
jgi:hypothetical protein